MDIITKDYLLKDLSNFLDYGISFVSQGNREEAFDMLSKANYIKRLLLRSYGLDIETDNSKPIAKLFHNYIRLYYFIY